MTTQAGHSAEPPRSPSNARPVPTSRSGRALQLGIVFLAGMVVGVGLWQTASRAHRNGAAQAGPLPPSVRTVLDTLREPVTLHFYMGVEDPAIPESDRAFARRVEEWIARLSTASSQIRLVRHEVRTPEDQAAAARAGIQPFHLERGAAAFLGVILEGPGGQRVLSRLDPAWEPALPYDLARAIAEVGQPPPAVAATPAPDQEEVLADLRQTLGDPESVGLNEGATRLREASLEEFRRTAASFQSRQADLQKRFQEAEQRGDTAAQQAILREVRQLQAEQTARLQALAQRLQAQLELWQKLKSPPAPAAATSAAPALPPAPGRPHR
ncbi:hypothetical protein [Limisphaera sp. 4302-co]|uniref:hypothetical protein n=1 Tax=Limisphaera sp. 4302-co TaxID=3400417 RepID=UPI003C2259DB